jgi:hypothetical protein
MVMAPNYGLGLRVARAEIFIALLDSRTTFTNDEGEPPEGLT